MSERREAMRARFRASAVERVRSTWFTLVQLHEGHGGEDVGAELARELHGLKGDAGLFRYEALSAAIHALEEVLERAWQTPDVRLVAGTLARELEVVLRALETDPNEPASIALLTTVRDRLVAEAATLASTSRASVEPAPPREEPPADVAIGPSEPFSTRSRWLQVDVAHVDDICDRLADLHSELAALASRMTVALAGRSELRWIREDLDRRRLQLDELATAAWALRLSSVEICLLELAQHARTLATAQGKQLRIDLQSGGVELERYILDAIHEPLLHLIRNAVDHGLEAPSARGTKSVRGTLVLHASTDGSRAEIVVGDDGRGIDLDRIRRTAVAKGLLAADARGPTMDEAFELLFSRGFSTRGEVTELSGRGVGLDVVRDRIERLGGRVTVTSTPGVGTRFTLSVPTTVGRERYVVFESAGVVYGLPSRSVREILRALDCEIERVAGGEAIAYQNEHLPYRTLDEAPDEGARILVIDAGERAQALGVSTVLGELDLMSRPVDRLVARSGYVVASASLTDGRPILLVAPLPFLRHLDRRVAPARGGKLPARPRILVVDDSPLVRGLVASLLSGLGYEVEEAENGLEALEAISRDEVHLLISDVEMPVMNGFELLRRLRALQPHLPVVMLTTRGSTEDRRLASSLGANAYVVKSHFEQGHLVATVRRLLGQVES